MHWKQCNVIARMLIVNPLVVWPLLLDQSTFTFWEETFWWECNIFIQGLALWIKYIVDFWPLWFYPVFFYFPSLLPSLVHPWGRISLSHILSAGILSSPGDEGKYFFLLLSLSSCSKSRVCLLFFPACIGKSFPRQGSMSPTRPDLHLFIRDCLILSFSLLCTAIRRFF